MSEHSQPYIKPSHAGIWHWDKEPLEHLELKASGVYVQELHVTGGNGEAILERYTQAFMCTGTHKNLGWT